MEMEPGQQLGAYRVIRLLGKGGIGAVYEVEHVQLGVHYALKTFTLEEGHVETLKSKFLAEGKVLARLRNPNLVHVFDLNFDEKAGILYFVMDMVLSEDGNPHTLSDIKTAELDEDRILQWFAELAAAVDYIHEQGVVHRDIKLGNVLLAANDHVVLSDFGVSHLFSDRLRTDVNAVKTMVSEVCTCNRLVMGTQGYIAPEIVRGEEATPAADSYSLGVMFVYLLTGIWYELGSKVFKLLETLEYPWVDVLPRLLAENPAERSTNLTELAGLLVRKAGETPSSSGAGETPPPLKDASSRGGVVSAALQKCLPRLVFAIASAAIFLAAAIGFYFFSHRPTAPSTVDDLGEVFGSHGIYEAPRL